MSAITGIFYRDGRKVGPELIKKMNDRLSHRGPDGSAVWCEGPIALGHQMLWTTPESLHEKLPFEDNESGLVITADARIDNRDELSKELDIDDKEEVSDSYFILKAYQMWGEDCPDKLLGDFAFAIWDKNEEKLFCARDHMGVKPFYYYLSDEMFVFGTEIKALFCVPGVPHELNEKKVALFLMANDSFEKKLTFYENINSLNSAHFLILDKYGIKIKRYWKLNPKSKIIRDSDEDYADAFYEIFAEAVKCRLRSYIPIGVMLSGGLDSSSVACMARKLNIENKFQDNIQSFSFIFDDYPTIDERYYIKKVLDKGGIKPYFIKCDEINPLKKIDDKLKWYDQPLSTYHRSLVHESGKMIQKNGLRVILTGEGGDQVVSHGIGFLEELLITFQWKKLINNIKNMSKVRNVNKYKLFLRTIFYLAKYYLLKWPKLYYFLKKEDRILNKNFLTRLGFNNILNGLDESYNIIKSKAFHYYDIEIISHQLCFELLDQEYAMFCVDNRHPFYDKRLIEFCYAIPTEMKLKFGYSRYILRIAMDKTLPREIQWRSTKSKMGIASINNFLSEKEIIERVINDTDNIIGDYVDLNKLKNVFEISLEYKESNSTHYLWRVLLFYLWLLNNENLNIIKLNRQIIDKKGELNAK